MAFANNISLYILRLSKNAMDTQMYMVQCWQSVSI